MKVICKVLKLNFSPAKVFLEKQQLNLIQLAHKLDLLLRKIFFCPLKKMFKWYLSRNHRMTIVPFFIEYESVIGSIKTISPSAIHASIIESPLTVKAKTFSFLKHQKYPNSPEHLKSFY